VKFKTNMMLVKETRNFLVYGQTEDGQTVIDDTDAKVLKWYLSKEQFDDWPELITVTIEAEE